MAEQARTIEQIQATITAARDSVWVIDDSIIKLTAGSSPSLEIKGNLDRNVEHLKLVVADQEIIDSGENIVDLQQAILDGQAALAGNQWPPETELR
jgi:hypothetical protein